MVHLYRSRRHDCLPSGAPYALTHPHQESPSVSRGVVPCEEVWLSAREARERSVGGCVCVCVFFLLSSFCMPQISITSIRAVIIGRDFFFFLLPPRIFRLCGYCWKFVSRLLGWGVLSQFEKLNSWKNSRQVEASLSFTMCGKTPSRKYGS